MSSHLLDKEGASNTAATYSFFTLSPAPKDREASATDSNDARPDHNVNSISSLDGTSERSTPGLGPRRGSFTSDIPLGHAIPKPVNDTPPNLSPDHPPSNRSISSAGLHATLSANLAPKSGTIPSQTFAVSNQYDVLTDSDPEFRTSAPMSLPPRAADTSTPCSAIPKPPQGYYNTYRLEPTMPPPKREVTTSARRVKNYTLPDGTVVSGKGLGRGRPGIKRGPRNPKYQMVDPNGLPEGTTPSETQSPPPSTPAIKRRKRMLSGASEDSVVSEAMLSSSASLTSESRDSSPEYNPTDSTRSGRKVQKPTSTVVQHEKVRVQARSTPIKLERNNSSTLSPAAIKNHPKIKRRMYRGREQLALCEHCLRGHGPTSNVIIFCDACNKCWHQRCHDPPVAPSIVSDSKAEWYCLDCDRILHGKKSKKQPAAPAAAAAKQAPVPPAPTFIGPLIGGATLSNAQKQNYLQTLSKEKLITLILSASELAPALPLFQAATPAPSPLPLAKFTSNYITPVTSTFHPPTPAGQEDDEGYDSYFDDHVYLYPKPGHGLKLPPESTDLHMLLEGKDSKTFSHWVRGIVGREYSGSGDLQTTPYVNGHAHG
jgi:hypothetical protein